jgi:pimeloyl-ACP methyl ester carboxylesterase
MATSATDSTMRHQQVALGSVSIHAAECGTPGRPAVLFLHGWPQDWSSFERVMRAFGDARHLVAIDLPGIGQSQGRWESGDKVLIARLVKRVVDALELSEVTLVGHDVGGQVVFAYLREFPDELARAVMMNIAVPGVEPWSQVVRNPRIWHFAFHNVPALPELLVRAHIGPYFDFFFDALSARRDGVSPQARAAYVRAYAHSDALRTGFDWYRAFEQDERHNQQMREHAVRTPVLYLRGQREGGVIEEYLKGFRAAGLQDVRGALIADSGHYAPDEQPAAVADAIRRFVGVERVAAR